MGINKPIRWDEELKTRLEWLTPEEKEIEYNNTRKQFYNDELVHFPYSVDKVDNNRWTRR